METYSDLFHVCPLFLATENIVCNNIVTVSQYKNISPKYPFSRLPVTFHDVSIPQNCQLPYHLASSVCFLISGKKLLK